MEQTMERSAERTDETSQETLVNYMPGMPTVSEEPSRFGRVVRKLFRRRGGLRPVVRQKGPVAVTSKDE